MEQWRREFAERLSCANVEARINGDMVEFGRSLESLVVLKSRKVPWIYNIKRGYVTPTLRDGNIVLHWTVVVSLGWSISKGLCLPIVFTTGYFYGDLSLGFLVTLYMISVAIVIVDVIMGVKTFRWHLKYVTNIVNRKSEQ